MSSRAIMQIREVRRAAELAGFVAQGGRLPKQSPVVQECWWGEAWPGKRNSSLDLSSPTAMSVAACITYCGQNTYKWLQGQKRASAPPRRATDRAGLCREPSSGGIPGSHGSGHYGSGELHTLLWTQQSHSLAPEHHLQAVQRKALCEVLLAVLCGVPLKNHVL